jgi:hypothetical protein
MPSKQRVLSAKAAFLVAIVSLPLAAQETRGSIAGRVTDPAGGVVVNASVAVANTETSVGLRVQTNDTGYYEANLLIPGRYEVSVEASGFKKFVRKGLTLPVSTRIEINISLELGALAETVSVTAEAPLLDTSTASSGSVVDTRTVMDLPTIANNTMVLVKLTPGIQTSGVNDYLGPHSNVGASDYSVAGNVGGNEWSIDGVPNNGAGRRSAYLPVADTVQEMKVETSGFDASMGHSSGANIAMMTKAGTNQFHGSLTEQHWQQRWHGTPFFTKQLYYRNIAAAEAAGDKAKADELRSQDKQASGRSNNYTGTVGGPVWIPKVFDGRNRLFYFFSYQGNKDSVADLPSRYNNTIPTMDDRTGNFSRHLGVNAGLYQLHDPLSVRPDPARPTHFIRDPIPGNIVPKGRMINPAYEWYKNVLPTPNNDIDPKREPLNNYLSTAAPLIRDYKAYSNRFDYQLSDKHRFFARWSFNDWINDADNWTFQTLNGLQSLRQTRTNLGGTVDWVYAITSATILDVAVAANNYWEGNRPDVAQSYKPSDVGLPAYIDEKADTQTIVPVMNFSGYRTIGRTYPTTTFFRTMSGKADLSHIRGHHSLRMGFDYRGQHRTANAGGNTSGTFNFSNHFTRRNDDTITPAGSIAHSWAAFLMGLPDSMTIATNDSYAMFNPYYSWYVQDNWRLAPKLSLNIGLRMEYERGPTERFSRTIGYFDPKATLPITTLAQAAYARSPIPEKPPSTFSVLGGSIYPGSMGAPRNLWRNELMWLPRFAAAYQANSQTVIRVGYGAFFDTLNVLNDGPDQTGYSRTTSTQITNDFGMTWLAGDPRKGVSPLNDPFPVRQDGTRFDAPTRETLGLMARAGRGWTFDPYEMRHARQQRWRAGIQRQIGQSMIIDAAYAGSYSDRVPVSRSLSPLPEQFWARGLVRDNNIANNMNANVTNPFQLANFASLKISDPVVYQDMTTQSFYTSATIRKNQLLRDFPQMNGITTSAVPSGAVRTHALELQFQRRFSEGFNLSASYTFMHARTSDLYLNEFDASPAWRESNAARPHRFIAAGIYEFPFGKGRRYLQSGFMSHVAGGFQSAASFEWQPGPVIDWGNLFYYGDLEAINTGTRTLDRWFNTANFETVSTRTPAAYHRRVFPTRIDDLRAHSTNQWNVNLQREFRITEQIRFQIRVDALNIQNRTQFAGPNVNPVSTDFARITSQTNTRNRFLQLQVRLRF